MPHYLITSDFTGGMVNGHNVHETELRRAKLIADRMFGDPGYMNVELTEPLGVQLTMSNGDVVMETCSDLAAGIDAVESWKAVIANRKINRTRVRKAEMVGVIKKTAIATEEDKLVGEWMAAALDDRKVCPSMKFDINRWMDSKEWT